MVIREGQVLRVTLEVECTVSLGLVGITTCLAIEEVNVVYPYHSVLGVDAHAVVHAEIDTEVAQLNHRRITDEEAEAPDSSVVTHTLNGDVHVLIGLGTLNLQTLVAFQFVHVTVLDGTNDTHAKGTLLVTAVAIAFLVTIDDVLQTCIGSYLSIAVGSHFHGNRFRIVRPYIQHTSV